MLGLGFQTRALVTIDTPAASPLSQRIASTALKARETHVENVKTSAKVSYEKWKEAVEAGITTAADTWFCTTPHGLRDLDSKPFVFPESAKSYAACALIILALPEPTRQQDQSWSVKLMLETIRPELERDGFEVMGCGISGASYVAIIGSPELAQARRDGNA